MRLIFWGTVGVVYVAGVLLVVFLRAVIVLMGLLLWAAAAMAAWIALVLVGWYKRGQV